MRNLVLTKLLIVKNIMSKVEYNKQLKCKDCKNANGSFWSRITKTSYMFRCNIPEAWVEEKYDPVFGKTTPGYYHTCGVMRGKYEACGPEGKKWVPRSTKLIFLALKNN